jgi:hypothetical protein
MQDQTTLAAVDRFTDRAAIDEALKLAFYDAVRRHRQGRVPMVFMKNGKIVEVSGYDIPLPEDEPK